MRLHARLRPHARGADTIRTTATELEQADVTSVATTRRGALDYLIHACADLFGPGTSGAPVSPPREAPHAPGPYEHNGAANVITHPRDEAPGTDDARHELTRYVGFRVVPYPPHARR